MTDELHFQRRNLFDDIAATYDRARPEYPVELIGDLLSYCELKESSRILEIGSGTGRLTMKLADAGLDVTALELGKNLARLLESKLKSFPNARVINGNFEEYRPANSKYDLIAAATSFHWLEKSSRTRKISELLGVNGSVAIIETHHVDGGTGQFFRDSQKCYRKWDPNTEVDYHLPGADSIIAGKWDEEFSEGYEKIFSRLYEKTESYDSKAYVDLLTTYSDVLAMTPENRKGFLECIRNLIDSTHGGIISKKYLMELYIARKK